MKINNMQGAIIVNKSTNMTSRDVINILNKEFNTKAIGHIGTLDPLAQGVLVCLIGKYTKLTDVLVNHDKEYIASFKLGILTDTLDITGKVLKEEKINIPKEQIKEIVESFKGTYNQEVPIYSAVKVGGKKLYEYARSNIKITPPSKEVEIYSLTLLEGPKYLKDTIEFKIKCKVSKGTYIRSLIRDIAYSLNTYGTMKSLVRTKQGSFSLDKAYTLEDIQNNNYKLLTIREVLPSIKVTEIKDDLLKKVQNGMPLPSFFSANMSLLVDSKGREIAIYKKEGNIVKPYKMIEVNNE